MRPRRVALWWQHGSLLDPVVWACWALNPMRSVQIWWWPARPWSLRTRSRQPRRWVTSFLGHGSSWFRPVR
ncbi:hypothetical protein BDA96_02G150200 [Sorghum bicolor]|uniref:Uncharacterized protein n=1 Tax=Sorghum bicolor TaxID=4558 RepID=A0A921RNI9_SORBI|nr:hypothetical protein BDA96_02G150200 [Sorghum bicolor]